MLREALFVSLALWIGTAAASPGPATLVFETLARECAPQVHPATLKALVRVESSYNPYAIGVVGGHLARQPRDLAEAIATAQSLDAQGWNFSLGLGQINRHNLAAHGHDYASIFEPCANLRTGAAILTECFARARARADDDQAALRAALSCYYSGNFTTGFRQGYVQKVVAGADVPARPIPVVPAIERGHEERTAVPESGTWGRSSAKARAQAEPQNWVEFGEAEATKPPDSAMPQKTPAADSAQPVKVERADKRDEAQPKADSPATRDKPLAADISRMPDSRGEPFFVIVE